MLSLVLAKANSPPEITRKPKIRQQSRAFGEFDAHATSVLTRRCLLRALSTYTRTGKPKATTGPEDYTLPTRKSHAAVDRPRAKATVRSTAPKAYWGTFVRSMAHTGKLGSRLATKNLRPVLAMAGPAVVGGDVYFFVASPEPRFIFLTSSHVPHPPSFQKPKLAGGFFHITL